MSHSHRGLSQPDLNLERGSHRIYTESHKQRSNVLCLRIIIMEKEPQQYSYLSQLCTSRKTFHEPDSIRESLTNQRQITIPLPKG